MFEGVGLFWHRNGFSWINSVVTNLWDLALRSSEFRWTVANSLVTMHHTPASILTHLFLASGSLTVFTWHKKWLHQFLNHLICVCVCVCVCAYIYIYTGCPRRKGPNFGRVFLRSNYNDITQNAYIQSSMVTEILAREVWNFDSYYSLIDYQIHIETGRNMWFL